MDFTSCVSFSLSVVAFAVFCVDPSSSSKPTSNIGRCDYSLMCDEQRVEKLVEGLEDTSRFKDHDGEYLHVCDWKGVTCDDAGSVIKIDWDNIIGTYHLKGSMELAWIPPTVTHFDIANNKISGSINTAMLPRTLKYLYVDGCGNFSGTINWTELPTTLINFWLTSNKFHGCINFDVLPISMRKMYTVYNKFTSVKGKPHDGLKLSNVHRQIDDGSELMMHMTEE